MKRINYESDFKIVEGFKDGSSMLNAPFRFTYYTKMTRGTYVAEYDGTTFTNCSPTEDGRVVVAFDSPQLGMGVLMVKREFFLNDSDFADGVCNLVSVESTNITLDKGVTDDLGAIEVLVQPYYHVVSEGGGGEIPNGTITEAKLANQSVSTSKVKDGAITEAKLSEEVKEKLNKAGGSGEKGEDGKSAYDIWLEQGNEGTEQDFLDSLKGEDGEKGDKGDKMTYDDLTEEEKSDLASRVEVEVPTKTSQLTNDSGYVTIEEVSTAINSAIVSTLNTEI